LQIFEIVQVEILALKMQPLQMFEILEMRQTGTGEIVAVQIVTPPVAELPVERK
jgi:hypothetical protein